MEGLDDLPDSKIVELYPQNLPRRDLAKELVGEKNISEPKVDKSLVHKLIPKLLAWLKDL